MNMLRSVIILLVLIGFASAMSTSHWQSFKSRYGKIYQSQAEESMRRSIFAKSKLRVEQFNQHRAESAGYKLGLSHLSDRTDSEIKQLRGFRLPENRSRENSLEAERFIKSILDDKTVAVPDEVDWRKIPGRVSWVKNQGQCGSCWAFATTGLLEGQEAMRNVSIITGLSEQNIVDCSKSNEGCKGGYMEGALKDIRAEGGIESEASYVYHGSDNQPCRFDKNRSVLTNSGSAALPSGNEQVLKEIVAKYGPVAVGIDAGLPFLDYSSGIFYDRECSSDIWFINHAVLVVGYGSTLYSGDYWIVKNSWSSDWGEEGYIKMARNRGNNCGIATYAVISIF